MKESDFVPIAVDDLLRCPRNRNAGTDGRHYDEIALGPACEITDVAIVRQNLRPELEVGGHFEDIALRRIDDDRVRLVHDGELLVQSATQDKLCKIAGNETKSNNAVTNQTRLREMRASPGGTRCCIHLQL